MQRQPRILVVDANVTASQQIALALDGAGFEASTTTFAPATFTEANKTFRPTLLLVEADLGSSELTTLQARLEASGAELPIALLCTDTSDEIFVRTMRQGIVEMLEAPFAPRFHVSRLRMLLAELPDRTGALRGRGAPQELNALMQNVMRTRRTGGLIVNEGAPDEARAFFVRGVLKSARYERLTQQPALAAMSRLQRPWAFTEGAEGSAGLIDFDVGGDPFMMTFREHETVRTPIPQQQELSAAPQSVSAPQTLDPENSSTRILFVDDEQAVVSMLASYFAKKGFQVATAADGVEAMPLLIPGRFDVVVADLNMPRLDGWGLLRLIREDFRTHEVPVALYSAQDDYREALRLLHAGAQAYFPKSLRLSALEAQVKELLEPRRRFVRLLPPEGGLSFHFGSLGTQWVVRALADGGFSGQLDGRDGWGTWRAWFVVGRLVQVQARIGQTTLTQDRALASFLSSTQVEGTLSTGGQAPDEGFSRAPTDLVLQRVVPLINDERRRAREEQLHSAKSLVVHEELYRLYVTVGPPAWLPIARLLCEQHLAPAEVIHRLQCTPQEVAAVVKDLLRRGVVALQA